MPRSTNGCWSGRTRLRSSMMTAMAPRARGDLAGVGIRAPLDGRQAEVLSTEALRLVVGLQRAFGPAREALLRQRAERQLELDAGALPDFLDETAGIRSSIWQVAPVPSDLRRRRVEITGP